MVTGGTIHKILDKIDEIYMELRFIRNIIEKRLVGEDEPLEDETEAIREYEERKKRREVEFIPLEEILGE